MLNIEKLEQELQNTGIGFQLYGMEEVDSTNRFALNLAKEGAPQGTVVCAEYQTEGRGRMARKWFSSPGDDLLFSILLRPRIEIEAAQKITLAAAVIVYQALQRYCLLLNSRGIEFDVKWPNDILTGGKKICGILAESVLQNKHIESLALGFGININMQPAKLESSLKERVTSLKTLTGMQIDRTDFLVSFLRHFDKEYLRMESEGFAQVVPRWKALTRQIGRQIVIQDSSGSKSAEFVDLSSQGYLVYKTTDGKVSELAAGDVQWQ